MVDAEPGKYRPKRAFIESDPTPAAPAAPLQDLNDANGPDDLDAEDRPKPLYRDEVATAGSGGATALGGVGSGSDQPTRPITFTPRRPRSGEAEATTILPRLGSGGRRGEDQDVDDLDDDGRRPLGQRTKLALLIGAVAAVVVIGLAVGYAVLGVGNTPTTRITPSPVVGPSSSEPTPSPEPSVALLAEEGLLSAKDAGLVSDKKWKVVSTERGASDASTGPACFGPDPLEGQPAPQQRVLRLLSSGGDNAPGLLHEATAYASVEEAAQAYAVTAKAIGSCEVVGSYLVSGHSVSGLGDQATGVVVASTDGDETSQHTMIVNRTGRVLNIVDATRPTDALSPASVAKAAAAVTARECGPAGGKCGGSVSVKDGPPPLGGDEPGFLATGDLPPAGKSPMLWVATPPELPKEDFLGSQCESVNWSTLDTEATTSRVYILQDSGSFFGLNDIVVTMKSESAAEKLVDKLKSDLESCEKRKLTAEVSKPKEVEGAGARKTDVAGFTAEVSQRSTDGTKKYRVGFVAAGTKVAYTFLNPQDGFDFDDEQWDTVAVRAGQRTTQVN